MQKKETVNVLFSFLSFLMCFVVLVKRTPTLSRGTLFTLHTLPLLSVLCTWKSLALPPVGYWTGVCGRLWRCHREGHAPLLSEWVMQQPLPWKANEKKHFFRLMFESALWVLSVGGCGRWWLVTFTFRYLLIPVQMLHKGVFFKKKFIWNVKPKAVLFMFCWCLIKTPLLTC